ncbi:methyl-accepting chemotaxis protein [Halalkalibacter hemicellulosilyticusJCM 9152]|uniref:Methyl-accepting chemotaxis protein n=2 Tax=Halalkalibacter TaxID=2893056 RepID=W4QI27_9BACI|nr:methyl-accepting chemotaxis protein [Halalkalibacter hemicellulosilyticusJCM 9152]
MEITIYKPLRELLREMNITGKLFIGFISILISLSIVTGVTFSAFSYFNQFIATNDDTIEKVELLNSMEKEMYRGYLRFTHYLNDRAIGSIEYTENQNDLFFDHTEALLSIDGNSKGIEKLIGLTERLQNQVQEIINSKELEGMDSYTTLLNQNEIVLSQISEVYDEVRMNYQNEIKDANGALLYMSQFSNKAILTISIVAIILGLTIAIYLSRMISRPLKIMATFSNQISQGNLSVDKVKVKSQDEVGQLAHAFNKMVENTRNLITNVRSNSEQVAASSEELMVSSTETSTSANQIVNAIQEVASGSENQVKAIEESTDAINDLEKGVKKVTNTIYCIKDSTSHTTKQANDGHRLLSKVILQMDSIYHSANNTIKLVNVLDDNSKRISYIMDSIADISDKTSLLALNATIEASRAGGHGKGFAVVANEIRKLAEQSRSSASDISKLVTSIQKDIAMVVEITNNSSEQVKEGYHLVEHTEKSFTNILNAITQVAEETEALFSLSDTMSTNMEVVNSSMKEVASISNKSMTNTEEIAASSEEQLAITNEVDSLATDLASIANELKEQINRFRT